MKRYSSITVIYNPNSTGPGLAKAESLAASLADTPYAKTIKLIPTEYAGHAEELTYELSKASLQPLIISSSGDGGYHEVINGAMKARSDGFSPVTGILPAGNANDHYRNLHDEPVEKMITTGQRHFVDLLRVKVTHPDGGWQRFAHSYAGVGLTPEVGHELNQVDLNPLNEKWIAFKSIWQLKPVRLRIHGEVRSYDSLIFSNVPHMSKVLHLSKEAKMNDGQFEVTTHLHRGKWELLHHLFKASTTGLAGRTHVRRFQFQSPRDIRIQLDGEVKQILAGSKVTVSLLHQALECVA